MDEVRIAELETRIKKLETLSRHLSRKPERQTKALITPVPISSVAFGEDIRGPILRYMFASAGTVTKGMLRLRKRPKVDVELGVAIYSDSGGSAQTFTISTKVAKAQVNIPVKEGDCLEVSVKSNEPVQEVWVAFLWTPIAKEVKSDLLET